MEYADIISQNRKYCSEHPNWTKYAFHLTDVGNAVSILECGKMYSRLEAVGKRLMKNDNASRQVIDITALSVQAGVRFYFRPLTPTQYHNEGYKHPDVRYQGDDRANIPVPVFFLFDLETLLQMPSVYFSKESLAKSQAVRMQGAEEFARLPFSSIYNNQWDMLMETKSYRHAEIVAKSPFPVDSCLRYIFCRTKLERLTLLNLLREKAPIAYEQYRGKVFIPQDRKELYYNNGFYVSECRYQHGEITLSIQVTRDARAYCCRQRRGACSGKLLSPLRGKLRLQWYGNRKKLEELPIDFQWTMDSSAGKGVVFTGLPEVDGADSLRMEVSIEESLLCCLYQPLGEAGGIF
ncbi:MAG: DarT ssDNA thymidine ADP-ribosyltransferase family protein [Akkermansia sp.]